MLNTVSIGDIGEAVAQMKFIKNGCVVSKPLTNNARYDFIVEINNYKTIIKQIDKETPGLLYLIFENKENVSDSNINNINKGIELFKEMTNLFCQDILLFY